MEMMEVDRERTEAVGDGGLRVRSGEDDDDARLTME